MWVGRGSGLGHGWGKEHCFSFWFLVVVPMCMCSLNLRKVVQIIWVASSSSFLWVEKRNVLSSKHKRELRWNDFPFDLVLWVMSLQHWFQGFFSWGQDIGDPDLAFLIGVPNWGLAPYDIYSVNGQTFICPFLKKVQQTKMLHAYLSIIKRGNEKYAVYVPVQFYTRECTNISKY